MAVAIRSLEVDRAVRTLGHFADTTVLALRQSLSELRATFLARHIPLIERDAVAGRRLSATLEKLHGALMFLSRFACVERAQIATLARLGVFLARIQPILA
jgi:hypothetical protein